MERDPRVWIATLRNSHERLAALVEPLSPEQVRTQSYDRDWSEAQVLSHLGSGAEISLMSLPAALGQAEPLDRATAFQPVWDVWNAKSPDEQAADSLAWDEKQVRALEQLSDDELAGISMPFIGGMILDAAAMVGLRLGEHALHTWDVAVTFDPAATVAPDAVDLLIDNVPGFLAPRLGRAPEARGEFRFSGAIEQAGSPFRSILPVHFDDLSNDPPRTGRACARKSHRFPVAGIPFKSM